MSLCPYAYLRVSLSGLLTASDQGSLTTFGELFNISALDPLLPTLLIATLCLCALLTILYYSLVVAWEVFWASRRSPSPLDPSAEVVLTVHPSVFDRISGYPIPSFIIFRHRLLSVPLLVTSEQSDEAFREYLIIRLQTLESPLIQFIRVPTYFAVIYDL